MSTDCSEIFTLIDADNRSLIQRRIDEKECLDTRNHKGQTPLRYSIGSFRPEIAQIFIDAGVDVNLQDDDGETPLYATIKNDYPYLTKYLLEHGANPNILTNYDWSPLMLAVSHFNPSLDIIMELIRAGADINVKFKHGKSVFDLLVSNYLTYYDSYKKQLSYYKSKNNERKTREVLNQSINLMTIIYQLTKELSKTLPSKIYNIEQIFDIEANLDDNPQTEARNLLKSFLRLKILQERNTLISVLPKDLVGLIQENLIYF